MTSSVRVLYLASELFSDATIAVSDIVRERLVRWGVPSHKITTIPNGVNIDEIAFDPAARQRVPRAIRNRSRDLRDRISRSPRPQQASRPDDGSCGAYVVGTLQDTCHRPWRGPRPPQVGGGTTRCDRQRDIRGLPIPTPPPCSLHRPVRCHFPAGTSDIPCSRPWPMASQRSTRPVLPLTASTPTGRDKSTARSTPSAKQSKMSSRPA